MYKIDDKQYEILKEWVYNYIDKFCIVKDRYMPGKVPGSYYIYMFYLRRGLFNKSFNSAISRMFIYKMEREIDSNFDFQISGLETAATPLLIGLPYVASEFDIDLNSFVVRKEQKEYGLKNWIEGIPNDKKVLLMDDLCNSGDSMGKAYKILSEEGFEILPYALSIVKKNNAQTNQNLKNIKIISLFDFHEFNLNN
jgi:orotate phosphoribosyltransferase